MSRASLALSTILMNDGVHQTQLRSVVSRNDRNNPKSQKNWEKRTLINCNDLTTSRPMMQTAVDQYIFLPFSQKMQWLNAHTFIVDNVSMGPLMG